MAEYTNAEYYDMVMCVGECRGNLWAARELYRDRYVDVAAPRRLPSYPCFRRVVNRLHTTGSVRERNPGGRPVADRHGVIDVNTQVRNYLAARFPQWIGLECGTEEQMRQRIVDAFAGIDPPMIRRAVDSVRRRTRLCIQQQGRHI
ncbi:hypothetical protein JYU34_008841 [Plutella xylostella]|uniref:DUF4817 domain-containing protein n=1 Tax=Plutella xylostella TaxID=51655 RepID=A0ABQ7QLX9_PLUXY|nr:hypothetical protein JYU34_008841 [Plutella xylostella]